MLQVANIFGNHMILQRQKDINIWGKASPGEQVHITCNDQLISTTFAKADGSWSATLPAMEAAWNLTLLIESPSESVSFNDICIGEVWIAGGQSNMEYYFQFDAEKEPTLAHLKQELTIRFFDTPRISYEGEDQDRNYIYSGFWRKATQADLPYFSAVAYYFANNLAQTLQIPIGIIGCNWGGTPACTWLPKKRLAGDIGKIWITEYENATHDLDIDLYKKVYRANPANDHTDPFADVTTNRLMYPGLDPTQQQKLLYMMERIPTDIDSQMGPYHQNRPGGLYETMLCKIMPYTCRGVIWYQGESDDSHPTIYATIFRQLIQSWRDGWQDDTLPFLFVQLAPFTRWLHVKKNNFSIIRKQQEQVAKTVPYVWMASASDNGLEWDIHPKYKRPIGRRLSLLALGHVYHQNILCDPPELEEASLTPNEITLTFKHGEGLFLKGAKPDALYLTDPQEHCVNPSDFCIQGNSLLLKGHFSEATTVHFADTNYYNVNLYNEAENPAKPFTITL